MKHRKVGLMYFARLIFASAFMGILLIMLMKRSDASRPFTEDELKVIVSLDIETEMIFGYTAGEKEAAQRELKGKPDQLNKKLADIAQRENQEILHLLDLYGLSYAEVEEMQKRILGQLPSATSTEEYLATKKLRDSMRHKIEDLRETYYWKDHPVERAQWERRRFEQMLMNTEELLKKNPHFKEQIKQEIKEWETRVNTYQQEAALYLFPYPKNEVDTFFPLELSWWEIKGRFLEKYASLPDDSNILRNVRWEIIEWYRTQIRSLFRGRKTRPAYYDAYQKSRAFTLDTYVEQHPEFKSRWEDIQKRLNQYTKVIHDAQTEEVLSSAQIADWETYTKLVHSTQTEGMTMVIGQVTDHKTGKPLSGIEVEVIQQGGPLSNQRVPYSGGAMALRPPTWQTISNARGHFLFPALKPQDYYIHAGRLLQENGQTITYGMEEPRDFSIRGNTEVLILDLPIRQTSSTTKVVPSCNEDPYQKGCETFLPEFLKFCKEHPDGSGCENLQRAEKNRK